MTKYACAIGTSKKTDLGTTMHVMGFLVEAGSWDEAYGQAYRISLARFPRASYPAGPLLIVTDMILHPDTYTPSEDGL